MTEEYLRKRIEFLVFKNFNQMRNELPYKTGRLAYQSFKIENTEDGWRIWIDLNIAPYAVYLDDKPKTKGWWELAARAFISRLQQEIGGLLYEVNNGRVA